MAYGLIGKDISYSFSEKYFTDKFRKLQLDEVYYTLDLAELKNIKSVIKDHHLQGFNITIPYKEEIIPYLDELDGVAKNIKAVNCVAIKDGKWIGYNTDAYGFQKSLEPLLHKRINSALIFGTGGASKAITYVLTNLGIEYTQISRKGDHTYEKLNPETVSKHLLLINTTPVGTFPNTNDILPIPLDVISENHLVYDLIYNPEKTQLLKEAENRGARIKNGYEMLALQAEKSYEIWKSSI